MLNFFIPVVENRALADQLTMSEAESAADSHRQGTITFGDLRLRAAQHLREHADEFAPFIGVDPGSSEFDQYCHKVESVIDAEWGGQVEIRALSASLERQIHIYDSTTPLLVMGEDFSDKYPLKVTYHRHYYSLGEHYNSVERISD